MMTIKEQLILDIQKFPPDTLAQLFEFVQLLKRNLPQQQPKPHPLSAFFGILSDKDAKEMTEAIDEAFNHIEGEW